jgi:hypothetical protein
MTSLHFYEIRPRKDKRGFDLISDALPFGRLWVWRAGHSQRCSRLRKVFQPFAIDKFGCRKSAVKLILLSYRNLWT